jgi:hypothetical protein
VHTVDTVPFAADTTVFGAMAGDRGDMLLTSQGECLLIFLLDNNDIRQFKL